jgi:hypothetical protein
LKHKLKLHHKNIKKYNYKKKLNMGNSQTEKVHNASENHSQDVPKHSTRNKKTLDNQLKDQTRPTKKKGIEQEMV